MLKRGIIARAGVQDYDGLRVYRSPETIEAIHKALQGKKLNVVNEHPTEFLRGSEEGAVGRLVSTEYLDGLLYASVDLDDSAMYSPDIGFSLGYDATRNFVKGSWLDEKGLFKGLPGETYKFDAEDVGVQPDHLALTVAPRGGEFTKIYDSYVSPTMQDKSSDTQPDTLSNYDDQTTLKIMQELTESLARIEAALAEIRNPITSVKDSSQAQEPIKVIDSVVHRKYEQLKQLSLTVNDSYAIDYDKSYLENASDALSLLGFGGEELPTETELERLVNLSLRVQATALAKSQQEEAAKAKEAEAAAEKSTVLDSKLVSSSSDTATIGGVLYF
jgi:hypothetical protein